jgi:protein associated with RNAse G/E
MDSMEIYERCVIKSFKHNGQIHRLWQQNWLVPDDALAPGHRAESMIVLINRQTPIQESDGKQWISRVPAVSFFIPGEWFNVVALLETSGVRYYCNVASPPYLQGGVLTYIDYDLDVIRTADGSRYIVDQDEYEQHKQLYHYPRQVEDKVREGLNALLSRIESSREPFQDDVVIRYYEEWLTRFGEAEQ